MKKYVLVSPMECKTCKGQHLHERGYDTQTKQQIKRCIACGAESEDKNDRRVQV
jgi:hypothetical protein